jgi:pimeloyl-ACP methyl ester carboxylesterase
MKLLVIGVGGLAVALVALGAWLWTPDKTRAELEARYLVAPTDIRSVNGNKVHVQDSGPRDAQAVVLIHGFGSSLQTWDAWVAILNKGYRVVVLDLPGFGLSAPNPNGDYNIDTDIATVLGVLDQLGIEKASFVGNSLGGKVAWNLAAAHPARVNKLVLISPDGFAQPGIAYGEAPPVPAMMKALQYTLPKFMLKSSLEPAFADPTKLTPAYVTRYYDNMLAPGGRVAMIARMEQGAVPDPVPILKTITAPTLVMWGEKDGLIPFANSADYMKALPNARLAALPNVGHVPQEEAPDSSAAILKGFLVE